MQATQTIYGGIALETVAKVRVIQIVEARLEEFTRFVFNQINERNARRGKKQAGEEDFQAMLAEERTMFSRGVYVAAVGPDGAIVGGGRVAFWQPDLKFPTERIFRINMLALARGLDVDQATLAHAGQLALDDHRLAEIGVGLADRLRILEAIVAHTTFAALSYGCTYTVAESDPAVDRVMLRLGFDIRRISDLVRDYRDCYAALIDLRAGRDLPILRRFAV